MSVNQSVRTALLDAADLIQMEKRTEMRYAAYESFLAEASDIAFRGRCVALMDLLDEGRTQAEIAEIVGVTERTAHTWIHQAAEVTGRKIPRSPSTPRVTASVALPERVGGRYTYRPNTARGRRATR